MRVLDLEIEHVLLAPFALNGVQFDGYKREGSRLLNIGRCTRNISRVRCA